MEKIEQRYSTRNIIVVAVIAEFFSSFTLWLVESSIKYPLFVIETLSIITIYVVLSNYDFRFTLKKDPIRRISPSLLLDIVLIYFASVLIVLNQFNITESTIRLVLAFICTSGLSGYALLNVCRLTKYFSKLEILVLSFLTSFALSGFFTLVLLWSDESIRSIVIPFMFILLGIASYLTHLKIKDVPSLKINSLSKNIDILPIILCIVFYAISFYYIYPEFTLLHATDISRYYKDAIILSRTPDLYTGFDYILFNSFSSTLNILSGLPTITSFLTILTTLSSVLPISVYVFAKRFLADIDRRIPAISIVFYTILSNFSFIIFTRIQILGREGTELGLLQFVGNKSYNGSEYFVQPFLWFAPITVAFIMFICAFLLLKVQNIPKSRFVPLYTALIMSMYFVHVADPIIFVAILGAYSMVSKSKSLRLDDALLSSFIAFILAAAIHAYTLIFWTSPLRVSGISLPAMLPVILPILLVSISMFWRRTILHKIHLPMKFVGSKKFYYTLSTVLVAVYLSGFLTWFVINDFNVWLVSDIYSVPWFIYPLTLGIVGLLALIAIRHFGYILPNSSIALLFGSIALSVLLARVISFVNLNFTFSGYFENRILWYTFLFLALLAPLPLIKLMDQICVKRKFFTIIGFSVIISLIIVLGFSSTVSQLEYWVQFNKLHTLTQKEFLATDHLKHILQHDPRAFTIGLSNSSNYAITFAASPYQWPNPEVIVYSERPEIPLFSLSAHGLPHAYIYTNSSDFDMLKPQKSWLFYHLLPILPIVFSNDEVTIYNATHVSYPRSNSDTHVLVPTSPSAASNSLFYAYDIISLHDRNYTVMFDRDQNALTGKTVILSYDPPKNNNYKLDSSSLRETSDYISYVKSGGNLIVLNTNGYGSISNVLFNLGNSSYEASKIVLPSADSLPVNVIVPTSTTKNVTLSGFYTSPQNKSSIFIADKIVGLGKITYVNIYPIISGFNDNRIDKTALHKIFDRISDLIDLNTINPDLRTDDVKGNFKEMIGNGNVAINSSSLIFPYDQFTDMTIRNNDKEISITNVTKLNINGYHYAILHGNHISIAKGMGLYGNASLANSLDIFFKNNATIAVVSDNNKSSNFDNVSNIFIQNNKPIQVYLWQPKININGNATFKQFLGTFGLGNTVYARQDINVSGNISWTLFMSDAYTYVRDISVSGPAQQISHKYQYNEVGSVIPSFSKFRFESLPILVDGLLFSPFLVAAILLLFGKSKNMSVKQI